jgi:hypothetical protein
LDAGSRHSQEQRAIDAGGADRRAKTKGAGSLRRLLRAWRLEVDSLDEQPGRPDHESLGVEHGGASAVAEYLESQAVAR